MSNQEPTIKDIFEIVEFIRDNGATKDDIALVRREMAVEFASVRQETATEFASVRKEMATESAAVRQEISGLRNEVIDHVDGFVGLYRKHEQELAAVVSPQNRFEEKLNQIIQHLGLQMA